MKIRLALLILAVLSARNLASAQEPATATTASTVSAVPRLIRFSGIVKNPDLKPFTTLGITFLLYKDQQSGAPLWMETQNVQPDTSGHYSVQLGLTQANGVPMDLFASGEARWLGVQVQGQAEQPRVLLLSVPYALKAADAETVGGLPPSAFVLATAPVKSVAMNGMTASTGSSTPPSASIGGSGTTGFLPEFTGATTIGNSAVFQTGTSPTAKIGINTNAPSAALDVAGTGTIRGLLTLPATSTATATGGKNSQAQDFVASSFSSSTKKAVNQTFQWQAESAGNNTTNPSGTLNLLFGSGTTTPTETGLKLSSKGVFTFAPGQTFPGTGPGTITGVTAGTALTGGGASGKVTLNVDTTKVPLLAANNTFTGIQTINNEAFVTASGAGPLFAMTVSGTGGPGGILGQTNATFGIAIQGNATSTGGTGVFGQALAGSGVSVGVFGLTQDPTGYGVAGSGAVAVYGHSTNSGGYGGAFYGFAGAGSSGGPGLYANGGNGDPSNFFNGGDGVDTVGGDALGCSMGALGCSFGGSGVVARGAATNGGNPDSSPGVGGFFTGGNSAGCDGDGCGGDAIVGLPGTGSIGGNSGWAGNFEGDIFVSGRISAGTKDFKIDHPLDPANKYLVHASVESSEMMNIYTGNVTTDAQGEATVQLPQWFEVLNTDFRYQLTVIGVFAQAIIGHEIQNHEFTIRTNSPNVKVSWQVTGVRQDAFAKAHPLVVEEEKDARLKGFYIHPQLYGQPEEKQIEWARHPQLMKQIKETRARQLAASPKTATRPTLVSTPKVNSKLN